MIDLHCHILPTADDGATSIEEAIAMARQAVSEGIHTIVATPHFGNFTRQSARSDIERRVGEFQQALDEAKVPLRMLVGSELVVTPDSARWHDAGELVSLNSTRYLLVEVPFHEYPSYTDEALFQLQARGIQPILAHPERYAAFQKNPDRVTEIVERGVLMQVTAGSLTGIFGQAAQRTAETLVRRGQIHIISTDAHTATGKRTTEIAQAVNRAAELVGRERAEAMARDVPAAIIEDREIDLPPVAPHAEKTGWAFWKRWNTGARA